MDLMGVPMGSALERPRQRGWLDKGRENIPFARERCQETAAPPTRLGSFGGCRLELVLC